MRSGEIWECWFDGDKVVRDTSRQPFAASAAENFVLQYGLVDEANDGEVCHVRVKAIGSEDETARLFKVTFRMGLVVAEEGGPVETPDLLEDLDAVRKERDALALAAGEGVAKLEAFATDEIARLRAEGDALRARVAGLEKELAVATSTDPILTEADIARGEARLRRAGLSSGPDEISRLRARAEKAESERDEARRDLARGVPKGGEFTQEHPIRLLARFADFHVQISFHGEQAFVSVEDDEGHSRGEFQGRTIADALNKAMEVLL